MPNQTQTQTGAGAGTQASSTGAASTGSQSTQPDGSQTVDTGASTEGRNNSGQGTADNGSDTGDSGRQRPTRVERRFGKLTSNLQKTAELETENKRLRELLEQTPDYSKVELPDYGSRDSVTPEEIRSDIVNAADQMVKIRLGQLLPEVTRNLTQQQSNSVALADIEQAVQTHPELDPNSDSYDAELEQDLADTFEAAHKGDPNYRFKDLVDRTFRIRGKVSATSTKAADTKTDNRSRGAIKPTSGTGGSAPHKAIADMTSAEYLAYVKGGGTATE